MRVSQFLTDMATQLGHDILVVPLAGADEGLDRLAMNASLDGDRLAGLALQATDQPAEDQVGVGPVFGPVEVGQVAFEEGGEPILAALDCFGGQDGVGQEGLSVGMVDD